MLPWLVLFYTLYSIYTLEVYRQTTQQRMLAALDRFSLVELTVLHKTIAAFLSFDPQDFSLDLGTYQVDVSFDGETAHIRYDDDSNLYGILTFDMIYGYVISYRVERNGVSD